MEYRCISADCHIDLNWLPHDLFVSNASKAMKDRMPYVIQEADGPRWVTKAGLNLGPANGKGGTGAFGGTGRKYIPGEIHRTDRMASTGLYADGAKGIFRPSMPELRLQDQERDGIQAEVMYGVLGSANQIKDREVALEFHRIYNDWLSDFCSYDRKRFVGLASIPIDTIDVAVEETRRVAKLCVGGLNLTCTHDMTPFWSPSWDPLWKAAAEANLPLHFHSIGPVHESFPQDMPATLKMASRATRTASFQLHSAPILGNLIHGGVLDRYPDLRVVLGETGIGWIPYVLDRMDEEYENRWKALGLKLKPSEYWRRQCRATFQNDRIGVMLLDVLGAETVMWGSDYPHPDGVFPDSQEYIKRQFGHLSDATRRKITCENVGKFYGLIPA